MNQCKALNFQIMEEEPVNAELAFQGEIIQGSGGIKYETDPTVPAWAKAENPPPTTLREFYYRPQDGVDVGENNELVLVNDNTDNQGLYLMRCLKSPEDLCLWYTVNQDFQPPLEIFYDEAELKQSFGRLNQIALLNEGGKYRFFVAQIGTSQRYKWVETPLVDQLDGFKSLTFSTLEEIYNYEFETEVFYSLFFTDELAGANGFGFEYGTAYLVGTELRIDSDNQRVFVHLTDRSFLLTPKYDDYVSEWSINAVQGKAVKSYVDNIVDSINSALDEIHAYAQGIISGGVAE